MSSNGYPLGGDGVIENLFHYLWLKDEFDKGPKLNVPDTIIYKYRQPSAWYFTSKDGTIKKKTKFNLTNVRIEEAFTRNVHGSDICGYYLSLPENRDEQYTIEYFDADALHHFLYHREKVNNGLIQRFIEPKGTRNTMIRAIWSPKVCMLERRMNVHRLQDKRYGMYERAVTYEGPEFNSQAAPVRGTLLPAAVQDVCARLVDHVKEVSFQKWVL